MTLTVDCSLHAECLSLFTSATAIFSLILLCGVILMVGFLNLEYYTGEWQDAAKSKLNISLRLFLLTHICLCLEGCLVIDRVFQLLVY